MTNLKLLIIDDEKAFRELACEAAERIGFDVVVTSNAAEFKQVFKSFDPTTILLDVVMPEIDGIELIQWLAGQGCTSNIVVATGYEPNYSKITRSLGEAHGLTSVTTLQKPVSISELRRAISPVVAEQV